MKVSITNLLLRYANNLNLQCILPQRERWLFPNLLQGLARSLERREFPADRSGLLWPQVQGLVLFVFVQQTKIFLLLLVHNNVHTGDGFTNHPAETQATNITVSTRRATSILRVNAARKTLTSWRAWRLLLLSLWPPSSWWARFWAPPAAWAAPSCPSSAAPNTWPYPGTISEEKACRQVAT